MYGIIASMITDIDANRYQRSGLDSMFTCNRCDDPWGLVAEYVHDELKWLCMACCTYRSLLPEDISKITNALSEWGLV